MGTRARSLRLGRWLLVVATVLAVPACRGSSGDGRASSEEPAPRVRIVSQNILHGIACPESTDRCDLSGRLQLFTHQLEDAGCPDIVGMQETNGAIVRTLRRLLPRICRDRYRLVTDGDQGLDREITLTTGHVVGSLRLDLAGPLRTAQFVRIRTEVGLVDFVTTHLASGSDDRPCDSATCPAPCEPDDMLNACQARQVAAFAERETDPAAVVVIAGDLNAKPGEPTNRIIRAAGFVDTHEEAGLPECDPSTGRECTSGRVDDDLSDLKDPSSRQTERIDFVYAGGRSCDVVSPTGLFNGRPALDDPHGLLFPSDHTAVDATLRCPTTPADLAAARDATGPTASTTTTSPGGGGPPDAETRAAITDAFEGLFSGTVDDPEAKLAHVEDREILRETFLEAYEATKDVAAGITVRIDELTLVDAGHADVTYTLLLDGAAVLDHLPGQAVREDGAWLVSRRTYCDVATQGADEIPAPCQ